MSRVVPASGIVAIAIHVRDITDVATSEQDVFVDATAFESHKAILGVVPASKRATGMNRRKTVIGHDPAQGFAGDISVLVISVSLRANTGIIDLSQLRTSIVRPSFVHKRPVHSG